MKRMKIAALILLGGFALAGCGSTIPAGHKGVYWKYFSGVKRAKVYKDGWKWHWPWNNIVTYDVRWNTFNEKLVILSADDLHMQVEVSVRLRPNPDQVDQLHLDIGPDYYTRVVQQPFRAYARALLSEYKYSDIPKRTAEIQGKILAEMRHALAGKHLELDEVELRHIEYPQEVIQAANLKLATQQRLEQKEYEKKIAEVDAQIKVIDAQGQQQAQEIVDRTLTQKYLQFRAIETQRAFAGNPNATFYFVPLGKDGLPVIIEAPMPEKMEKRPPADGQARMK